MCGTNRGELELQRPETPTLAAEWPDQVRALAAIASHDAVDSAGHQLLPWVCLACTLTRSRKDVVHVASDLPLIALGVIRSLSALPASANRAAIGPGAAAGQHKKHCSVSAHHTK